MMITMNKTKELSEQDTGAECGEALGWSDTIMDYGRLDLQR